MLTEKTGLIIPLVLWGPKSPKNRILQISSIQNGKIIITGSADGVVMQWLVDESLGWIRSQMVMMAHEAAISCISPISTSMSTSKFITSSEDGHICLWDSVDGRVIDNLRTNYIHRKMKPYALRNGINEILFCVGDYPDIIALHPHDLNILYTLNSRAEPDWITSITLVQPTEKHDVLIGVSLSGVAKLWSLRDLNQKENAPNVLFEDESKFIASKNVRSIACSERNMRMMLVVCGNTWQIIDPSNLSQLIVSECAIEALDGIIIDIDKVAIGFADSTIVLFQLPRSKLVGKQVRERFGENPMNIANIEQPFVFALLKGGHSSSSSIKPLLNPVKFYFDMKLGSDGKTPRRIAYRVDDQASISFWHIPKNLELLVSEFVRTRKPIIYEPTIKQSLPEAWSRLSPTPPSIAQIEEHRSITATVYVSTQGKLFLGRDDGSIMMMDACHAIMVSLLEGFSHENAPYRLLKDGHTAAINCFLYPFDKANRYDPYLLLSGGADFSVILWNITTGERVHRFCCQGGPIQKMLIPPPNCNPRVLNSICSIASDNSACLLSLKELKCILLASRQQFPIVDIRWRPLDDFLLLRCEDDSVYVWQIETGNLDRIITGLVADEIMDACIEHVANFDSIEDEAGANQAIQMLRALRHKNVSAAVNSSPTPQHRLGISSIDICCSHSHQIQQSPFQEEPFVEREEIRKIAGDSNGKNAENYQFATELMPPMEIIQLKVCSDTTHLILFNVDSIISGLLSLDYECSMGGNQQQITVGNSMTTIDALRTTSEQLMKNGIGQNHIEQSTTNIIHNKNVAPSQPTATILQHHSLFMDVAKLLISLIHAWDLDENVDSICLSNLKLSRPKIPLCFGTISKGHISLYTPYSSGKIPALDDFSFKFFAKNIHWKMSRALTTIHLLALVALSNNLMALRNRSFQLSSAKTPLRRALSTKSTADDQMNENQNQQIKQGWSSVAALHCVLIPELVRPRNTYASPRIDLLARKWQDSCMEIRDAAQALLIRELNRMGIEGRAELIKNWANFLPTQLDPSISIFGTQFAQNLQQTTNLNDQQNHHLNNLDEHINNSSSTNSNRGESSTQPNSSSANSTTELANKIPPPRPAVPPIPPRSTNSTSSLPPVLINNDTDSLGGASSSKSNIDENVLAGKRFRASTTIVGSSFSSLNNNDRGDNPCTTVMDQFYCGGVNQIRRNQATAIIVLGIMGAEFSNELQNHLDICRSTAHSLLELLLAPESTFVPMPQHSLLRRAAIDLLGRGFAIWQPHLDLSKILIGLLNLAAECERHLSVKLQFGAQLTPEADACRTARHALSLIASSRPQALITALNMEVVRYNAVVQHQTIQHPISSPLMKARNEVLRLLEQLSDKQYNFVVDLIVPVGDILVHCLDLSLLKQRTLAEVFPPIARFYMVAYCPQTRRLAFGGKNGAIVIHELRASKAQSVKAHNVPITALAFSQDGKYLAAYAAQEAKISFWQAQQTFLGMGQSQIRCAKTLPAPGEFPVISPGGSYQVFRARLVWINSKSLTLMLPNGKENRFSV